MIQTNEKLKGNTPGTAPRYGVLNQCMSMPARLLCCALAVLVFLAFTNPAQTALLGRATLAGTAFSGDGLKELIEAENQMDAAVNALDNATDAAAALAAVEATLGAEAAALQATVGGDMSAAGAYLTAAADALTAAQADSTEDALYAGMEALWNISGSVPTLASQADAAAMGISDAMWYEPAAEGDPSKEEKLASALTAAVEMVAQAQADMAAAQTAQADSAARLAEITPVLESARGKLADENADVAAVLQEVKAVGSAVTRADVSLGQAGKVQTCAIFLVVGVVIALAGMVISLGNNRMRKLGLPVLAGGAVLTVAVLAVLRGALEQAIANAANVRAAYAGLDMPEALSAALDALALDVPTAWIAWTAVAALTAVLALAGWLTLPREVESAMHMDLCTIFQRLTRVLIVATGMMVFFPALNPGRVSSLINENASLFTVATSYGTIVEKMEFALSRGVIGSHVVVLLMIGAAVVMLGILLNAAGACMSLGNNRMKKKGGYLLPMAGSAAILAGLLVILSVYHTLLQETIQTPSVQKYLQPMLPGGIVFWAVAAVLVFACSMISWFLLPDELEEKMEMDEKYRNFLMFMPILLLTVVFCYLPIYGWRFAFFDYKIGDQLILYDTVVDGVVTQSSNFVGLKWFGYLFQNVATRNDLIRVLRNTLIMSGLGIATSWLPIAFAVLLAEVRSTKFQRLVQTLTTIPNFISWVLVYAIAFAIFSTDGFINSFLRNVLGVVGANTDYLASADWIWLKMLLWGTWKGLGWSAIVYIAGVAGIDQQLYEAARVDGANRFQCIRHITIPGLMPTYMVMLLMSVAGMLSNGMDQYLVFENAINKDVIEVLDLYVYNIGIKSGLIPLSTVVGVFKSLIGVTLLFGANGISKAVRGESII